MASKGEKREAYPTADNGPICTKKVMYKNDEGAPVTAFSGEWAP